MWFAIRVSATEEATLDESQKIEAQTAFVTSSTQLVVAKPQANAQGKGKKRGRGEQRGDDVAPTRPVKGVKGRETEVQKVSRRMT